MLSHASGGIKGQYSERGRQAYRVQCGALAAHTAGPFTGNRRLGVDRSGLDRAGLDGRGVEELMTRAVLEVLGEPMRLVWVSVASTYTDE